MSAEWIFKQFQPGDTLRNPVTGNFFSQDAIADPAEALVRESIQNSLDARVLGKKVIVRINVANVTGTERRELRSLLEPLLPHLEAPGNGLQFLPNPNEPCRFAVIEDFGTRGLEGDPNQYSPREDVRNDFFSFFRAEGYTSKGGDDRGRWGVGKTVFPRSSEINAFFGITIRASEPRPLFMGRCILMGHQVAGTTFHPDGYFGNVQSNLVVPVEEPTVIEQIRRIFGVRRTREPGLSVVVPFLQNEIDFPSLVAAVLRGFFFSILTDDLEVEISNEGRRVRATRETIYELAAEFAEAIGHDLHPLIDLARWGLGLADAEKLHVPAADLHYAPTWDRVDIPEEVKHLLREALKGSGRIALRVGFVVRPKGRAMVRSWYDVFLQAAEGDAGIPLFIREGLIISNAGGKRSRGVRAIVNITDKPSATFLGDAENVAHTEWNKDRDGFKAKYEYAPASLRFVQESVAALVKKVTEGQEDKDPDLLKDFFFFDVPLDEDLPEGGNVPESRGRRRSHGPPVIPRSPPRYRVSKVDGGFAIARGEEGARVPDRLLLRMAYDTRIGNPLKQYDLADFESSSLEINLNEGVELEIAEANRIMLKVLAPGFHATVTGFDKNRDVFVNVDALDAEEAHGDRPAN